MKRIELNLLTNQSVIEFVSNGETFRVRPAEFIVTKTTEQECLDELEKHILNLEEEMPTINTIVVTKRITESVEAELNSCTMILSATGLICDEGTEPYLASNATTNTIVKDNNIIANEDESLA